MVMICENEENKFLHRGHKTIAITPPICTITYFDLVLFRGLEDGDKSMYGTLDNWE